MPKSATAEIAVIGIDIGKYTFHVIALDRRGRIVLRQKFSRSQLVARLANLPACLIGMEACGASRLVPGSRSGYTSTTTTAPSTLT